MRRLRLLLTWLALVPLAGTTAPARAQTPEPSEAMRAVPADSAADVAETPPRSGWYYVLPVVAYSPETKFAFGATAARYYRLSDEPDARPTTISPLAMVTTNSQIILGLFGDLWWSDDRWHLATNLSFSKYPTQFYGIGDDTPASAEEDYTPRTAELFVDVSRALSGAFYLGAIVNAKHTTLRDLADGGLLAAGGIAGAEGGALVGAGISAAWDTRDAVHYPTRGWYHRLACVRYLDGLGSDFTYTAVDLTLTRYWSLGGARVLALNLAGASLAGDPVPFYELSRLRLRGYFEERYLERHAVRAQLEFRTPVWRRLGAAVFVGAGELAARLDRLRLDEVYPAAGCGVRYNLGGEQRANLRLDVGFGDGDSGVYVRFAEAF
ncbi:MAG TPA: BamA/TamA family outer membrane protein [Candidatus Krumholzibacteria bacterium]|nr:BamA/TamA family outer membrane protein [Candidatus Krumholzibacteria bacterium]HPD71984.1 BamA/TamA family outer membrane protein [Candidatus Krumholzibacteria bacterium]HRY41083.1 BamA/TamA family outer membrane protein [Candidatus Krumholzibacteria bacterium]